MEPIVLFQHKWSKDLFIPAYLFFGGLTAGVFIVAAVSDLVALRARRFEALSRVAALANVPILALAGFFLTAHLGKPERGLGFPLFFTNYNSWMTRGGWVVSAAALLVLLYAALWYFRALPPLRRTLAVVGLPLLAFLAIYTGLLLSGSWFVPLWSRKFLPLLFLNSGLTTGVAAAGLVFLLAWPFVGPRGEDARRVLRWLGAVLVLLIALELYELREFLGYLGRKAPDKAIVLTEPSGEFEAAAGSRLAYEYVTGGEGYPWRLVGARAAEAAEDAKPRPTLAPWFWIGVVGAGLALPLVLSLLEFLVEPFSRALANGLAASKFGLVLAGGFMLRLVIVWGGDLKAPLPFPPQLWPLGGPGGPPFPGLGG